MTILECKALTKRYGEVAALDGVDLSLEAGQVIGLLGPNGSGKTTLIKLANGLIKPTSGQILIEGMPPCVETKAKVAYLPDRDFLPEYMSTAQLLDYYQDFFADLGLDVSGRLKELSRGTREKVQLILTMSRRAHAYLLDEPIAGVDPAARDYILRTIISNYSPDSLVLISTHLIAGIEGVLDDVVFLKQGSVVLHELADDLRERIGKSIDGLFREVFAC
ncbi:ABC transporter ATP-binding protein [Curtanaerobium respiraculi]|uniref:ABC transporter ATP-binding protein n=1 Tax=Curtanaerobium respiraculi TaxID=2949669 RepID=UPI0024B39AF1|nr:ABC transporter ATP-binding protein [Curtanaerobium respiraculi]